MNNKFFVPVLALGIAALGAAASPSQAATATLGFYSGPASGSSVWDWSDQVTLSGLSFWRDAQVMAAQDGGPYSEIDYQSPGDSGPGTFSVYESVSAPGGTALADGHSYSIYFVNEGYSNNPELWSVSTKVGTASRNNSGTINADAPG